MRPRAVLLAPQRLQQVAGAVEHAVELGAERGPVVALALVPAAVVRSDVGAALDRGAGLPVELGEPGLDLLGDLGADGLVAVVDVLDVAGHEGPEPVRVVGEHRLDTVVVAEQLLELVRRRGGSSGHRVTASRIAEHTSSDRLTAAG